ncbi:hypothetical protein ACLOJK_034213, partial [Asimina triloba]
IERIGKTRERLCFRIREDLELEIFILELMELEFWKKFGIISYQVIFEALKALDE